ncbi:BspA family leucine-rich repeat surface protein [Gardnerella greenwoodii]|nr:BspA family leucine-rich repeat surface protein [Gardnerella greenwoodii]MDF0753296.1 BspA family leucine-rich repeat surface protein [Gardnerella greenwoodii]
MKKINKYNRSVFVPLSAGFCATALAITGGVVANASAVSSVASSSSVVKSSAAKVAKKANPVTGGQTSERSAVPTAKATKISQEQAKNMAGCEAVIEIDKNGKKFLVIKPKNNANDGIISADLRPVEFEALHDVIKSDEASDATLKFEGKIYGYGSLSLMDNPSDVIKNFSLFSNSKIKSLGNIDAFDVSNVTDMLYLFSECENLWDISGLANWNTSHVTNMSCMFEDCKRLKSLSGLASWNTNKVKNMSGMFADCCSLESLKGLENWDTSHVTNMSNMFGIGYASGYKKLTSLEPLSNWNTSHVTNMSAMFCDCESLKNLSGLESWNVSKVADMSLMFYGCDNLTDISAVKSWNFGKNKHEIRMISGMFSDCGELSDISPIQNWADIFYEKHNSPYISYFMFNRRRLDNRPIPLTTDWFNQKHTEIFSNFASGAVFIFNEGNKIDENIISKFKTDENIAELLKKNIIITNNDLLLKAMKDKKADEDNVHIVSVKYDKNKAQAHLPAVLDSRINGEGSKPSSDPFEIVKHYIPSVIKSGIEKNSSLSTDYIAVASSELSSTSTLSDLFQTYTIKAAHKVTFMNDKSNVATVKVEAGGRITDLASETIVTSDAVLTGVTMPSNPSKDGYTFNGWNTKADGTGDAFTQDSVVDTDKVVYAQYTKNEVHNPDPTPDPAPQPSPEPNPNPTPGGGNPGGGLNPGDDGSGDNPGNNPDNNPGNGNNTNGSGDGTGNDNTKNDGNGNGGAGNGGNNTNGNNTNGSSTNRNRNGGSAGGNGLNAGGNGSNSSNSAKSNDSDSAKDSTKDHSDSSDSAKDSAKDSDKDSNDSKDSAKDSKSSASSSAKRASNSSNFGLVASIIGALVAVAAIVGGFFFLLFGKKRKKSKDKDEN